MESGFCGIMTVSKWIRCFDFSSFSIHHWAFHFESTMKSSHQIKIYVKVTQLLTRCTWLESLALCIRAVRWMHLNLIFNLKRANSPINFATFNLSCIENAHSNCDPIELYEPHWIQCPFNRNNSDLGRTQCQCQCIISPAAATAAERKRKSRVIKPFITVILTLSNRQRIAVNMIVAVHWKIQLNSIELYRFSLGLLYDFCYRYHQAYNFINNTKLVDALKRVFLISFVNESVDARNSWRMYDFQMNYLPIWPQFAGEKCVKCMEMPIF